MNKLKRVNLLDIKKLITDYNKYVFKDILEPRVHFYLIEKKSKLFKKLLFLIRQLKFWNVRSIITKKL